MQAHRCFYTQNLFHRETFAQNNFYICFCYTQKTFDTENLVHTDCTQTFLQTDFFALRNFTQNNNEQFFTQQKPFRTDAFMHKEICTAVFTDRRFLHRKFSAQKSYAQKVLHAEGFTHNIFYIQMLLHTNVFTQTQIAQKLVHTARVCTQPTFTQRGFASPSWSPTFRVSPLKSFFIRTNH